MFGAWSCWRWWLIIIPTSTKRFSCSAFFAVVPEYIDTPTPAEPSDLQRKDHPWMFSVAVAHNFHRCCPPTSVGWGLEIAGFFLFYFILVFISFHLSVQYWMPQWGSTELQEGTQVFAEAQLVNRSRSFVFPLKAFGPLFRYLSCCLSDSWEFHFVLGAWAVLCHGTKPLCSSPGMDIPGGQCHAGKAVFSSQKHRPKPGQIPSVLTWGPAQCHFRTWTITSAVQKDPLQLGRPLVLHETAVPSVLCRTSSLIAICCRWCSTLPRKADPAGTSNPWEQGKKSGMQQISVSQTNPQPPPSGKPTRALAAENCFSQSPLYGTF